MEWLVQLASIAPQLVFAVVLGMFIVKRDAAWQSYMKTASEEWQACFRESTEEYKKLAERLEGVIITTTEVMSKLVAVAEFKQDITQEIKALKKELQAN